MTAEGFSIIFAMIGVGAATAFIIGRQSGLEAGLGERRDAVAEAQVARAEAETKLFGLRNELRKLLDGA